jgi:hypothetical protein
VVEADGADVSSTYSAAMRDNLLVLSSAKSHACGVWFAEWCICVQSALSGLSLLFERCVEDLLARTLRAWMTVRLGPTNRCWYSWLAITALRRTRCSVGHPFDPSDSETLLLKISQRYR